VKRMRQYAIGLDLGGTWLKTVAIDAEGAVLARDTRASEVAVSADAPIEAIRGAAVALESLAGDDHQLGLGCPGAIDPATGVLGGATPHLPFWTGFPVAARAGAALGRPVRVENDANCAAFAEHRLGAARGADVSVTITIGTGVGCGIVIGGRLLRGARGGAGELGHLPLGGQGYPVPGGHGNPSLHGHQHPAYLVHRPVCRCGVSGCVEPLMSASGMVAAARAAGFDATGMRDIFAAAASGHALAGELIALMIDRLAATIAVAAHTLNPDIIVLGGGVANAGEPLRRSLEQALPHYVMPTHRDGLRLVLAELGEWAGAVGAGLLAMETATAGSNRHAET